MTNTNMPDYYARRAAEYERIYTKPKRQADLKVMRARVAGSVQGLDLLEIACGTGYWTQVACQSSRSIVATDYNEDVLSLARAKDYGRCPVTFLKSDAYILAEVTGPFSGALVGFWWSHVPKSKLAGFLRTLHSKLCQDACVVIFDNRCVPGSSTPIARADADGNTYQIRQLSDGSTHEVLKNFPTRSEVIERIEPLSEKVEFTELEYFWFVAYTVNA